MQAPARVATFARLAALAAGLALLGLLAAGPIGRSPDGAARAAGPLPACRYDDILTSPRGYGDWRVTLVDTILRVPKGYAPPDLVRVVDLGVPGRGMVRSVMASDLAAMSEAAAAAGAPIGIQSAYRSYAEQQQVFNGWVSRLGYARALQVSARPGHSEHQLGLAIDVRSDPPDATLTGSWGATPAGKWMRAHAWEHGFLMSYPKGTIDRTCYDYEPWHFRYVGRELAARIHGSGLTVREYLWANHTTTVVPPPAPKPTSRPAATPTAPPTPAPTPTAAPTATPRPTATATARPVTPAPRTLPPASPPPAETRSPEAPRDPWTVLTTSPAALAGAGLALGTIVMGLVLALVRRGRSGVGP